VRLRYRHLPATPRLFARWKMRLDPMFGSLARFVKNPRRILDIGCGYGIPSAWLLELFPEARVSGVDPDAERIRVAGQALGARGEMRVGRAPDLRELPDGADTALMLDVIHMLGDDALRETLERLFDKLIPGGRLILRVTIPAAGSRTLLGNLEASRLQRQGLRAHYRGREALSDMIRKAGFTLEAIEPSGREEVWFVARRPVGPTEGGAP
jgi:trans-aconitate methyltransferase